MRGTVLGKITGCIFLCFFAAMNVAVAETSERDALAFQENLHRTVDTNSPYVIIPYAGGAQLERKFAHRLLDGLWSNKTYREHLTKWLADRSESVPEKLKSDWFMHYHQAFEKSFDLLDDAIVKKLWRLNDRNIVYWLNRTDCTNRTADENETMLRAVRDNYLAAHSDEIAAALAHAIVRELSRQDNPRSGDRPVPAVMTALAVRTLHAVAATLPDGDGKKLVEAYSYRQPAAPLTPSELCQRGWIVAHAIENSALETDGISSMLMRKTITATAYTSAFRLMYKKK